MDTATLSASASVSVPDSAQHTASSPSLSASSSTSKLSNNANGFYNDLLLAAPAQNGHLSNGFHPERELDQDQDHDSFAPSPIMARPRKAGIQLISEGTQTNHNNNISNNSSVSSSGFIGSNPPTWPSGTIARFHTAAPSPSSSPEHAQAFQEQLLPSSATRLGPAAATGPTASAASVASTFATVTSVTAQPTSSLHTPMTPPRISSLSPKNQASQLQAGHAFQDGPASPPPSPPQLAAAAPDSSPGNSPGQAYPARFSSLTPDGSVSGHYFSQQHQHLQYSPELLPQPHPTLPAQQAHGQAQGQAPLDYSRPTTFALEPSPTLSATETSTATASSKPTSSSISSPASSISMVPISATAQPTPIEYALAALSASPRPSTSTTSSMISTPVNRPRPSSYAPTKITDVSSTLATMTTLAALPIPSHTAPSGALSQSFAQDLNALPLLEQQQQQQEQQQQLQQPQLQQQQPPFEETASPQQQHRQYSPRPNASVLTGDGASGAGGGYQQSRHNSPTAYGPPTRASTMDVRRVHTGSLLLGDSPTSSSSARHQSSQVQEAQGESSGRVRRKQIYRRNTYSADLASTSFQRSDDEMEMDELEEAYRSRMDALKKNSSRRMSAKRKKDDDNDRVLIGTRIGEDHVNYVLMYNMLTGIRVSVSRCNAKPQRALVDEDFTSAHKLAFDITGNELTPSSKYDFKFKDYAPWVFRHLREDFHIDASDYLVSLTSKYILSELGSPGKSGSFFYFSQDYRFIIKTIHHAEHKFMRKILKDYFNHVKQNPHTLLCRFFGLHRVKLPHGRKIHFVVMGNVFPPNRDIHETYDLKGSTLGRAISDEELHNNPRATQKDLNWVNRNRKLELGPEKRHLFVEQIKRDVELLARLNIMDYSLLIGIHDIERGNRDNIRDNTLKVFHPDTSKQLVREPSRRDKRESKVNALRMAVKVSDPQALGPSTLPSDSFSERRHCIFYADDGGLLSTNEQNERGQDLYYLGIIDILTPYNYVKKIEHYWKSMSQDKHAISSVNPREYASRFLSFMIHALRVNHDVLPALQAHPHSE